MPLRAYWLLATVAQQYDFFGFLVLFLLVAAIELPTHK